MIPYITFSCAYTFISFIDVSMKELRIDTKFRFRLGSLGYVQYRNYILDLIRGFGASFLYEGKLVYPEIPVVKL